MAEGINWVTKLLTSCLLRALTIKISISTTQKRPYNKVVTAKIFSYILHSRYSELLLIIAHCSTKVNTKINFLFPTPTSLFSLVTSLLLPLSLFSSLFFFFLFLSPVSFLSFFLSLFFFYRSHFYLFFFLSFSFIGLSFTFFFHPKRKILRFWVWVWAKMKINEVLVKAKSKETKFRLEENFEILGLV